MGGRGSNKSRRGRGNTGKGIQGVFFLGDAGRDNRSSSEPKVGRGRENQHARHMRGKWGTWEKSRKGQLGPPHRLMWRQHQQRWEGEKKRGYTRRPPVLTQEEGRGKKSEPIVRFREKQIS